MLKFKYKKYNDYRTSDRELVVLGRPSNAYFGVQVNDVEASTVKQLEGLLARHKRELNEFIADKELSKNYRTFLTEGIVKDL